MTRAADRIADILRGTQGAEDVKVEQTAGLPILEIKVNKTEAARLGLSTGAIQEVIGAAIGGRQAGLLFEGDRRFPIVVRLTTRCARTARRWRTSRCRCRRGPTGARPPSS